MARSAILVEQVRRMITFAAVTQVLALVLLWYGRDTFHPVVFTWSLFGLLIGAVEQFFFTGRLARLPVYAQLAVRLAAILAVGMSLVTALILLQWAPQALPGETPTSLIGIWTDPDVLHVMINALIMSAGVMLFMEMERLVGSRMFRRFLIGRYVHPKREDRVVMFMDLSGSTSLTEQLGDRRYFEMLNETFDRMTGPILEHGAEVLKYIGDEVVFTWMATGDERDLRCIRLFFDVSQAIERDRSHYQRVYGTVPRFRAGCHRGVVITAQIGSIKRTIDMSGDAMNTCARLAGATKDLDAELVVSEELLAAVPDDATPYAIGDAVPLELKGKADAVRAHVVRHRSDQ